MDEETIRNYFYKKRIEQSLFGENTIIEKVKEPIKKIAELYIQQLRKYLNMLRLNRWCYLIREIRRFFILPLPPTMKRQKTLRLKL